MPLRFLDGETEIIANEGSDAKLDCRITGYPPPEVTWVRVDGITLRPSADVTFKYYYLLILCLFM